ncbi:MAG TPA: carbohydrate-binding protein [Accumulibacter sp.]|jgi:hypothetical protein|nr:carbohydrate-binding protein [Accumulibacter sp.]HQC80480.1 carbohydrate-binding protein [Accumulibacter sp.]
MRKRLIDDATPDVSAAVSPADDWLPLENLVEVEITSEDAAHPIESALLPGGGGWRAGTPGRQTIRLIFPAPQALRRVRVDFVDTAARRTQEYLLRWSGDGGRSFRDIVRQQWNFSPDGANRQTEVHAVNIDAVDILELIVTPDIGDDRVFASLAELRLA